MSTLIQVQNSTPAVQAARLRLEQQQLLQEHFSILSAYQDPARIPPAVRAKLDRLWRRIQVIYRASAGDCQ